MGYTKIALALFEAEADGDIRDKFDSTAEEIALYNGHTETARVIKKANEVCILGFCW